MEAPQIVLPEEVNVISYCALDSAHHRPVRGDGVLDFKTKLEVTVLL